MSYHPKAELNQTNVLGTALASCCFRPVNRLLSKWFCHTGAGDVGLHTVCAKMTREFLEFSVAKGNDLVTPLPEFGFPGLQPNDFGACAPCAGWKHWMRGCAAAKLAACHEPLRVSGYRDTAAVCYLRR